MRRATQQALSVPTFRTSLDCTPWVLGGLWPPDLQRVTPETAPLADYLQQDLQRIANMANERLRTIAEAGLDERVRQSEESRVINVARAFAVQRVESTVRQLRTEPVGFNPNSSPVQPILAEGGIVSRGVDSHRPRPYDSRGLSPLPVGPSLRWRAKGLH